MDKDEALAQPAQEPVAWIKDWADGSREIVPANYDNSYPVYTHPAQEPVAQQQPFAYINVTDRTLEWAAPTNFFNTASSGVYPRLPLYTHPAPAKEWVGLSDDDIEYWECLKAPPVHPDFVDDDSWRNFAKAIEQVLKEKNYG